MGITIHYKGKAKSLEAMDELISMFSEISETSGWKYEVAQRIVRGKYKPFWGIGFGYIPSKEELQNRDIEFFPKMVTAKCNGYFRLFQSKYKERVRASLQKGIYPSFSVDTEQKGIFIDLHPKCETLCFVFDLKTLELINYYTFDDDPGVYHGSGGLCCKTQFAGFEAHKTVCKLIKAASKYIDYSNVDDESGYYDSEDDGDAERMFVAMDKGIREFAQALKDMGANVTIGPEI